MEILSGLSSFISGAVTFFTAAVYFSGIASAVKLFAWNGSSDPVMDTGIFDRIVAQFQGICIGGANGGHGLMANTEIYAVGLFHYLILFDFIIAVMLGLLAFESGPNFITLFANKIFKYGFWTWIMMNWQDFTTKIILSFEKIGNFSGSSTYISNKPSMVVDLGWTYAGSYLKYALVNLVAKAEIDSLILAIISILAALVIFLSFFVMAINLVITKVEYFISSSLMLIFIPFALFDKTERFASQVFNLVISCGVRLMILSALCSIAHEFFDPQSASGAGIKAIYTFKDSPGIVNAFTTMGLSALFGYLCCEIPQVASGVISGALQLNSNSAFMHAAGAIGSASMATSTAGKLAAPGVSGVAAAAKAYTNSGGGTAGAMAALSGFGKGIKGAVGDAMTNKFDTPFSMYNAGQAAAGFGPSGNGDKAEKPNKVDLGTNNAGSNSKSGSASFDNQYQGPPKNAKNIVSGATKGGTGNFNKPMS